MKSRYSTVPLTWEGMKLLIDEGQKESVTLDFKSARYDLTIEDQKDELAKDICAFANNMGGLLVIGIKDVNNSASEITPVTFSDQFESRCQQVIGSHVSPRIQIRFHRIKEEINDDSGILIIEISKSVDAPHGAIKDGRIRYAMRSGMDTRYLSEVEVSEMYRRRFSSIEHQENELQILQSKANLSLDTSLGWLVIGLVPRKKGMIPLNSASLEKFRARYANKHLESPITLFQTGQVKVGFGKFVIESYLPSAPTKNFGLDLFEDGSGLAYAPLTPHQVNSRKGLQTTFPKQIFPLFGIPMVEILVLHAVNAGAFGDFAIQVDFQMTGGTQFGLSSPNSISRELALDGELVLNPKPASISFDGDELSRGFRVRLEVCKVLFATFFQNFGFTDFPYISDAGALVPDTIDPSYLASYLAWEVQKLSQEGIDSEAEARKSV